MAFQIVFVTLQVVFVAFQVVLVALTLSFNQITVIFDVIAAVEIVTAAIKGAINASSLLSIEKITQRNQDYTAKSCSKVSSEIKQPIKDSLASKHKSLLEQNVDQWK